MENTTNAAPTGCYKCGRPGHWSRDCPSSSASATATATATAPSNPNFSYNKTTGTAAASNTLVKEKPKKVPRTRPKLTSDLLLSDDGLGFVLRHFPRSFKYRGRGHEVKDLGNLIGLYSEWHSHLLPYYSFDQFIHKVEQVAASRHVKRCIKDLRERVASGGDPTKLHEAPVEQDGPTDEQAPTEAMDTEGPHDPSDQALNIHAADDSHEDLLHEIYEKATEEPSQALQSHMVAGSLLSADGSRKISPDEAPSNAGSSSNVVQISEEQKARMEANRLKALERAAARAQPLQAS
ncbi:hypothetical protein LWI29_034414 [Acer saccharum]|uniref:CCHC-type domain-containing protein n=1 Tax=Acer saccharum TaxID=4024 RepID=A0AA39RJK1_ACESA|nr:hypothetical protein LWI29_034414 [Acer saccharum]KAK1567718.1 hypothetical protein Q3G72_015685 [Acer saccharum]